MRIRSEQPADIAGIRAVHVAVFETPAEASLVDALREQASPLISLLAEDNGVIVGHILFSPVTLDAHPEISMMGLAPMAVLPQCQRQGIGSVLVHDGLEASMRIGACAVVVVGHPAFYSRFGFTPGSRFGLKTEYDVPDEVFMAVRLDRDVLGSVAGTVKYHPAFANL